MKTGKRILLTLVVAVTVLGFSVAGYCHQPEIEEKGELGFAGYLNVEYGYTHTDYNQTATDVDASDIYVDELGLAFSAGLTKSITADALILYEENEDDAVTVIDEGYLSIVCPHTGILFAHFGKMYIPFADAESKFVIDPYTHDLGETRESVFSLGAKWKMIDFEIGTFNGDSDKANDTNDNTDDFFASLLLTPIENDKMTVSLSLAYMSDITDTDWAILDDDNPATDDSYTDKTGAYSLWLSVEAETGSILIEYIVAEDKMDKDLAGAQPEALNVEIVGTFLAKHTFGFKYATTKDFVSLVPGGDPDIQRLGLLAGYEIHEKATLNIEYLTAEDDKTDNKVDIVTAQLALEF